jgi:starch synthase
LKDTVIDMGDEGGYGIRFIHASVGDVIHSVHRAAAVFKENETFNQMRTRMMHVDNSWDNSAQRYIDVYQDL